MVIVGHDYGAPEMSVVINVADSWGVKPDARVGILGGSFNPAHEGHLHISALAREHLKLDHVIWMVSPQNPLKPETEMAPFVERFDGAVQMASADTSVIVSDIEVQLGTRYSADTLKTLKSMSPKMAIVWIMGADNLAQIDRWESWGTIFSTVPIAIFARPPYSNGVMACTAAEDFADSQLGESRGAELALLPPPAWIYFDTPLNSKSATRIRTGCEPE
jgi:nicotinate-nucleotide adenylyltransferase